MTEKIVTLTAAQVDCLASLVRAEIMGGAVRLKEFAVNELATAIGRNPKALYPHMKQMVEVGLIRQVSERLSGKRIEAIYAPISTRVQIPRDDMDPAYRLAIRKKIKSLINQTEREQLRYLDSNPVPDLSMSYRLFMKLPPDRIPELRDKFKELSDWARQFDSNEGAVEFAATFLMAPIRGRER